MRKMNIGSNGLKTVLLMVALTGLLLYCGKSLGGQTGLTAAFMIALAANFTAYWFSDQILLRLYRAKQISMEDQPQLYGIVAYLSENADIPMPKIYVISQLTPNAFATGRNPAHAAVAVTKGLLSLLNKEELAGVIAHELSHIIHRDTLVSSIAAAIGGAISMIANMAQWLFIFALGRRQEEGRGHGLATIVMSMLAPVIAILIQMAVSRAREFAADEAGAALCGNPHALANALRKIHNTQQKYAFDQAENNPATAHLFIINPLRGKQWVQLFATHPPTEERIRRLEGYG